jgi:shikimate kinase
MGRCWILLGMMGAGKSAVGRALAELSGRPFKDTDLMLQHRLGRPITQLFSVYGEDAFREHETSILRMLEPEACVLATGGGIVVREANWPELHRLGVTIYLKAQAETLIDRLEVSKKRRPLLQVDCWQDRVRNLLEQRTPLYERADISVCLDTSDIDEAAKRVFEALKELGEE